MQIGELNRSPAFRALTDRGGRADTLQPLTREQFQQTCEALIPQITDSDPLPFNQFAQAIARFGLSHGLPIHDDEADRFISVGQQEDGNYQIFVARQEISEIVGYRKVVKNKDIVAPYLTIALRIHMPKINEGVSYVTGKPEEVSRSERVNVEGGRFLYGGEVQAFAQKVFDVCQKTP